MKVNPHMIFRGLMLALVLPLLSACNKWLDVQPSDRVSDETLFSDPSGFRNALNGIYQKVAAPELYGRQLTWGLASAMGQDYLSRTIPAEYQKAASSTFTDQALRDMLSPTWASAYTAIANCNKLLNELDTKDDAFFASGKTEKDLIKGEAIAVRALLHFEMIRLFAPSFAKESHEPLIPYHDSYPDHIAIALEPSEALEKVIADLQQAQGLVAANDTLVNRGAMSGGLEGLLNGITGNGPFFSLRMTRLNYVAIHGLLARAYLYGGDVQKAETEAAYVYNNFGPSGKNHWWSFTTEANTNTNNRYQKMADDILFATYDADLISNITNFKTTQYPFQIDHVPDIFSTAERDYRRNLISGDNLSYKWLESAFNLNQNLIAPVMRLSEVYFIYSECLFKEGNKTEALRIFNQLRNARGKTTMFNDDSDTGFYTELLNEYRRDYMAEGQTIYAHKRLNMPMQIGTLNVPVDGRFTAIIPDDENL